MQKIRPFWPFIFAILWLIIRAVTSQTLYDETYDQAKNVGVLTNLLFILLLIFIGVINAHRYSKEERTFWSDIRDMMSISLKYVVSVTLMMALFYAFLSNEMPKKREADAQAFAVALDTEEELQAIRAENTMLKDLSREEILAAAIQRSENFTSLKLIVPFSLLFLLIVSFAYSLLAAFLFRNFLRKNPTK